MLSTARWSSVSARTIRITSSPITERGLEAQRHTTTSLLTSKELLTS